MSDRIRVYYYVRAWSMFLVIVIHSDYMNPGSRYGWFNLHLPVCDGAFMQTYPWSLTFSSPSACPSSSP